MSFLTPLALIGALLAIPIILMYMLRLRRREVVVSSTFLWQQILKDTEANTPWQRLRRNLLLLLQLLILAALVIALARPFATVPAVGRGQIVLLLDASASMNATDVNNGSRFDEAKRQALSVINTMTSTDAMTIIRVTDVAEVIATSTDDKIALQNAVNNAQPSKARADWGSALTLAIGGAAGVEDFNLVIVSDGGLGDPALLPSVPGEISYLPVGQASSNLAISALATSALPGQNSQLFTQVTNYGNEDAEIVFSVSVDASLFATDFYTIPAGDSVALISEQLPPGYNVVEANLVVASDSPFQDYLAQDNTAWAVGSGSADRRALLMTQGNLFVEQILRSLPGIEAFQGELTRGLPTQPFDLYILDGWLPAALPPGDLLLINPPRSTDFFTIGPERTDTANLRVETGDPRMAFVDFENVNILSYHEITGADWATPLISVEGGALLLAGEIDGRQVAILTFDIHDSDLPLQITWPVLMANLLNWFSPQSIISVPDGLGVGETLTIRPPLTADQLRITQPGGEQTLIPIDRQSIIYADTQVAGLYTLEVLQGEEVQQNQTFAVNLFAPQESAIRLQSSITLGNATIDPGVREEIGQLEFWPIVALLGLLILLIEWYVYHQRLRAPTIMRPVTRRGYSS